MPARLAAPRNASRALRRLAAAAAVFAAAAGLWALAGPLSPMNGSGVYDDGQWEPLSGMRADVAARRAGAAFDDAQSFWSRRFREELGRAYAPADLVYFSLLTPSPCAGADYAAGSFYCDRTGTASMDLAFLDLMGRRLIHEADAGATLLVGRVAAAHVQRELDALPGPRSAEAPKERDARRHASALQADCLTGVWASHSADWVGALEPGFYGRLIEAAREVAEGRPRGAVEPDAALLGPGAAEERAAAYGRGRDAGVIEACLPDA